MVIVALQLQTYVIKLRTVFGSPKEHAIQRMLCHSSFVVMFIWPTFCTYEVLIKKKHAYTTSHWCIKNKQKFERKKNWLIHRKRWYNLDRISLLWRCAFLFQATLTWNSGGSWIIAQEVTDLIFSQINVTGWRKVCQSELLGQEA